MRSAALFGKPIQAAFSPISARGGFDNLFLRCSLEHVKYGRSGLLLWCLRQIDIVARHIRLRGRFFHQLESLGRADIDTGLVSIRASRPVPVGRIGTQVAFCGFLLLRIPDGPVRSLRTRANASLTTYAFFLVDPSDIAAGGIHVTSARGAILHTERRDTLTANRHNNIVGILGE